MGAKIVITAIGHNPTIFRFGPDNVIILVENTLFREIFSKLDGFNCISQIIGNQNRYGCSIKFNYLTCML